MTCPDSDHFSVTQILYTDPNLIVLLGSGCFALQVLSIQRDPAALQTSGSFLQTAVSGGIKAKNTEFNQVAGALSTFVAGNSATVTMTANNGGGSVTVCSVSCDQPHFMPVSSVSSSAGLAPIQAELRASVQATQEIHQLLKHELTRGVAELRKMNEQIEEGLSILRGDHTEIKKKVS